MKALSGEKLRLPYAMWSFQKKFQALPNYLGRGCNWQFDLQSSLHFIISECGLCFTAFLSQAIIFSNLLCLRKLSASWQTNYRGDDDDDDDGDQENEI